MSMKKLRSSQGWESELEGLRTFIEESYPGIGGLAIGDNT